VPVARVGAVLHKVDGRVAVVGEDLDEFGAAVAAETDDARFDHFVFTVRGEYLFSTVNKYNTPV
jgi:hypothetical protein